MVETLKTVGAPNVRYSEVPGVGHQPLGFSDPGLFKWLAERRRTVR